MALNTVSVSCSEFFQFHMRIASIKKTTIFQRVCEIKLLSEHVCTENKNVNAHNLGQWFGVEKDISIQCY